MVKDLYLGLWIQYLKFWGLGSKGGGTRCYEINKSHFQFVLCLHNTSFDIIFEVSTQVIEHKRLVDSLCICIEFHLIYTCKWTAYPIRNNAIFQWKLHCVNTAEKRLWHFPTYFVGSTRLSSKGTGLYTLMQISFGRLKITSSQVKVFVCACVFVCICVYIYTVSHKQTHAYQTTCLCKQNAGSTYNRCRFISPKNCSEAAPAACPAIKLGPAGPWLPQLNP